MRKFPSLATTYTRPTYSSLDKRNTERLAVSFKVRYKGEVPSQPHAGQALTKDISVTGCKLVADGPVTRGTLLTLAIHLPDGEAPLCLTAAHVVWASGCQFSVRFLQLSQEQRKRLQSYIWKNISHATVHNQRTRFRLV
ncbi:MAG TPA: PilZ domain-containing protein [Nitrospira sp.]|nr:PilZ domain-containing protein [Nitrospira sp.]